MIIYEREADLYISGQRNGAAALFGGAKHRRRHLPWRLSLLPQYATNADQLLCRRAVWYENAPD